MRNGTAKSVLVFVTGLAAGSAAALLLAPQSGRRTRREITRRVEDAQDYFADLGGELIEKGQDLLRQGRRHII